MNRSCLPVLVLLFFLCAQAWSHPHISRDEARVILAQSQQALTTLKERHGGAPPRDHGDADQWRQLRVRIAECHFLLGDIERSLQICNDVVATFPQFPDVYSMRRAIYQYRGEQALADADVLRYLELGAGNPALALALVKRPVAEDDVEQAQAGRRLQLALAESALKRWPEDVDLWAERFRLLIQSSDERLNAAVEQTFTQGSEAQRETVFVAFQAYHEVGTIADVLKQHPHAWLALPPQMGESGSRVNIASLLYDSGLLDHAARAAKAACARWPRRKLGFSLAIFFTILLGSNYLPTERARRQFSEIGLRPCELLILCWWKVGIF